MKYKYVYIVLLSCAIIAIALGVYNIRIAKEARFAACEHRTFDYITFIKMVRGKKEKNSEIIYKLNANKLNDPIKKEKIEYFMSVNKSLDKLIPLVEKQIELHGATYSCVEEGYSLLMWDIDYPTFSSIRQKDEMEFLWKKIEKREELSLTRALEIILGPLVALIIGILGFYKERRKR